MIEHTTHHYTPRRLKQSIMLLPLLLVAAFMMIFMGQELNAASAAGHTPIPIGTDSYKIVVNEDGIYQLTYEALQAQGMDVDNIDPNTFQMMHMGHSVAYALTGNGDATFEPGEAVLFYGWEFDGLNQDDWLNLLPMENSVEHDKLYITENVFWLWANGDNPVTAESRLNSPGGTQVTTWRDTVLYDENLFYDNTNTDKWDTYDFEATAWYRASIFSNPPDWTADFELSDQTYREYAFEVIDPVPDGTDATLLNHVFSACTPGEVGTHEVKIQLNNSETIEEWTGTFGKEVVLTVPASDLINGPDNAFRIENVTPIENVSLGVAGNNNCGELKDYTDKIHYDKSVLQYDRMLKAVNDELIFTYANPGTNDFVVNNFSSGDPANAVVWDVTERSMPTALTLGAADITDDGGSFTWTIGDENFPNAQYVATTPANFKDPVSVNQYNAPNITQANTQWVVISHGELITEATRLAEYRANPVAIEYTEGLTTFVVDVEDVINQYGYGYNLPQAIQSYLLDAHGDSGNGISGWAEGSLKYVVLFGDGSLNPRQLPCVEVCGYWGTNARNLITTDLKFYDRFNGLVVTDHTYANLIDDGTDLGASPEVAVGRFAANTLEEAKNMVDKVILYEQNIATEEEYLTNLIFIADDTDDGGNFCESTQAVSDDSFYIDRENDFTGDISTYCLPDNTRDSKVELRADIYDDISTDSANGSAGIVNYRGHGGRFQLGGIINVSNQDQVDLVTNAGQPLVWISADCLDGDFAHPDPIQTAVSETLMRLGDLEGTAGHWSSTGLGFDREHTGMHQGFYEALYQTPIYRIGDAIVFAKERYLQEDLGDVAEAWAFTYQGDPAMTMPFAAAAPTAVNVSSASAFMGGATGVMMLTATALVVTSTLVFTRRESLFD